MLVLTFVKILNSNAETRLKIQPRHLNGFKVIYTIFIALNLWNTVYYVQRIEKLWFLKLFYSQRRKFCVSVLARIGSLQNLYTLVSGAPCAPRGTHSPYLRLCVRLKESVGKRAGYFCSLRIRSTAEAKESLLLAGVERIRGVRDVRGHWLLAQSRRCTQISRLETLPSGTYSSPVSLIHTHSTCNI